MIFPVEKRQEKRKDGELFPVLMYEKHQGASIVQFLQRDLKANRH